MSPLLDSPLDNKCIGLAKILSDLRQHLDIYWLINRHGTSITSGKQFFGFIQHTATAFVCLDICKIYELEKETKSENKHELNSINGVRKAIRHKPTQILDDKLFKNFIEKYGSTNETKCHYSALKKAAGTFYKKHATDIKRFKDCRNKLIAHSEYNFSTKELPSYEIMEELFSFGADFCNTVSSTFMGAGTYDLNDDPVKRSFTQFLEETGILVSIVTDRVQAGGRLPKQLDAALNGAIKLI